ncbi:MAG: tetratricopeptide repeat protein, partial [Muribaculaceae bacterium]
MKKVIFFIAILLLMPCHECELYAQKKKVTASNRTTKTTKSKETIEFEKLLSKAKKGDPEAQTSVGDCYAAGRGVAKDLVKSMEWFQKAIDSGYGGACYWASLVWSIENDYSKRLDYLRIGVTLNDEKCCYNLYCDYNRGEHGVEKNENLALELLKKGTDLKIPELFYFRYLAHKDGKPGFAKNKEDAIFWLKRHIDSYYENYRTADYEEAKQLYNKYYKEDLKELKEELGCDYDPALHVDEYKAWLADKPAPRASKQQSSTTYSSSPANTTAPTTYHYTKSGRGQSQNTGQWTDDMASQECEVEFFDDYITVNGMVYSFVKNSGTWKLYGGTSMGFGGY